MANRMNVFARSPLNPIVNGFFWMVTFDIIDIIRSPPMKNIHGISQYIHDIPMKSTFIPITFW